MALAILAVGLAACGGDGGGGVAKEDFGARVQEALCERYARCGVYPSAEACERHWPRLAGPDRYGLGTRYDEALASGRLRYDEDAAERCVESIRDRDCRLPALSLIARLEGLEYDPACQVLRADQPGTDCALDLECGEHGYCAYAASNACQGRCEPRAQEGEVVTRSDACELGLMALVNGICAGDNCDDEPGGVCERPLEQGQDCREEKGEGMWRQRPCADGLWCDGHGSGLCERTASAGEACEELWGPPCAESLFCKQGRCARRSREGEPCTSPNSHSIFSLEECQQGLFCDADPGQSGTCRGARAEGDACRTSRLECAGGMSCDARQAGDAWGTCGQRPGLGEACDRSTLVTNCAAGFTCSQELGQCVPFAREGEPCGGLVGACGGGGLCSDEGRCLSFEAARCG